MTPMPQYWLQENNHGNFGDMLSWYFMERLFYPVPFYSSPIRIIGSCIDDFVINSHFSDVPSGDSPVTFWGCGMRSASSLSSANRAKCQFLSVRGPLTRDSLELSDHTVLGDSGLLLPLIYSPSTRPVSSGVVYVPHFHEVDNGDYSGIAPPCDTVLSPKIQRNLNDIHFFIDTIYSAEFVLTSSLHAAVVAFAYKIPFAYWDNGNVDVPFKWADFSASVGALPIHHKSIDDARRWYDDSQSHFIYPDLLSLLGVSPFAIRSEVYSKFTLDLSPKDQSIDRTAPVRDYFREETVPLSSLIAATSTLREMQNLGATLSRIESTLINVRSSVADHDQLLEEIELLHRTLDAFKQSTSWKLTAPIRYVLDLIRRIR